MVAERGEAAEESGELHRPEGLELLHGGPRQRLQQVTGLETQRRETHSGHADINGAFRQFGGSSSATESFTPRVPWPAAAAGGRPTGEVGDGSAPLPPRFYRLVHIALVE